MGGIRGDQWRQLACRVVPLCAGGVLRYGPDEAGSWAGWVARCFVDGEVLAVRVSGRLAVKLERGQYRLAGLDTRNVKTQDLTQNTRFLS